MPFHRLILLFLLTLPIYGQAWALSAPKGPVVLSVSGQIGVKNQGELAVFDMAMLAALPQVSFTTRTPWFDRPVKFTGPLMRDVLAAVQASGSALDAVAINDYRVNIPVQDAHDHALIIARLIDDLPISVREKGPLFVTYPFDGLAPEATGWRRWWSLVKSPFESPNPLRSSVYYERSIWQLKQLEVR